MPPPPPRCLARVPMSGTMPSASKPNAELAEPGLLLVDDEQHAALVAELLKPPEPTGRRLDGAAGAEQRLGDDRGRLAGRLGVDQLETRLETGELAFGQGLAQRAAIAVRRDHRVGAAGQRAMPRMPAREGDRHRGVREAVEAQMRAEDLAASGVDAGHHHRLSLASDPDSPNRLFCSGGGMIAPSRLASSISLTL
jgi:hypothetical protein